MSADTSNRRTFYPEIEPYQTGKLKVSSIHELYYELVGNPDATQTAVFLHGGPGGGLASYNRQFFDPKAYRVVLYDQRGSGQSTPHASLEENTTWDLVEDIEKLRKHVSETHKPNIEKWVVFGGSWGSTLALAYAETYPERVKALILRGIFTLRRKELIWFYQEGASFMFPEAWDTFIAPIPEVERFDLMSAYHRRLTGNNEEERKKCAKAWTIWELSTSRLYVDQEYIARATDDFADAFARIECHYFVNGGFFKYDGQLLQEAGKLKNIPGVIVQGRYDMVCPATTAWDLKKHWPQAEFYMIPDAGHSAKEDGIISELVKACDKFATI